jgi:hypothetical protein
MRQNGNPTPKTSPNDIFIKIIEKWLDPISSS